MRSWLPGQRLCSHEYLYDLLALKFVASSEKSKFMICSDSLSCLLAIESCKTQNPFILKIVEIIYFTIIGLISI
jgi:hypothetical protein